MKSSYTPRLIAWEVTKRCALHCKHCRASAENIPYQNELSFDECARLLDAMTTFSPPPIMILTGGDPLMRADIFDIARYGTEAGLRMVIALCGHGLTAEVMQRLKASGILKISFSLDGSQPATHDSFRGQPGSFDAVMQSMALAQEVGIPFQVNSTISTYNLEELPGMLDLAMRCGADAFHPFLLVPTGNAKNLVDLELSPDQYERTLHWIYAQSQQRSIMVKPTCAPHYYRIVRQQGGAISSPHPHAARGTHPGGQQGFSAVTKGCLGGQGFAFVSHVGIVQICGFLDIPCGDLRAVDFDMLQIWDTSPVFQAVRNLDGYHGKCGVCEYRRVCGGCRARAYHATGDYLGSEPFCAYIPKALAEK